MLTASGYEAGGHALPAGRQPQEVQAQAHERERQHPRHPLVRQVARPVHERRVRHAALGVLAHHGDNGTKRAHRHTRALQKDGQPLQGEELQPA
eukprot:CAMPEP_0202883362 /NCGR_PEP_ID=MMETSP1391-20130828/39331_1 /ASSEMBLY_ACC=CAM_ASM_000867 /TAXON_ID=1034604 /ORGANISM="Chlamydomonas leiostraca, Strain SAG 11-49" /LENGTH=93 /DNA_ID=CAMNT_0049566363 /DNA_START=149 /DNA_END=430 /DNA_ORIENTATION=-